MWHCIVIENIHCSHCCSLVWGWCFSSKFCTVSHILHISIISSTLIAKHRSLIKLKFLQNFWSSCKTLADQVARNPRFYCTHICIGTETTSVQFFKRLIVQSASTVWTRINYKTLPVTNLNKHLHYGTSGTEWCSFKQVQIAAVTFDEQIQTNTATSETN
jgi:hypothetical protein